MEKKNGEKYETIMARSFSRQERSKIGWWACLAFFLVSFVFCFFFKPYTSANNVIASSPSPLAGPVRVGIFDRLQGSDEQIGINIAPQQPFLDSETEDAKPICNVKKQRSDICRAKGDIRVISNSSTIIVVTNAHSNMSWNIRPYPRKADADALRNVRNLTIVNVHPSNQRQLQHCTRTYHVPAIVFSLAGYTGNLFHDFADVIIPLFLTTHEFGGEVQFLVTDYRAWWVNKYKEVLQGLSKHEIIALENEKDDVICFPRIIVGLEANKEFSIDTSLASGSHSMKNFIEFLRSVYHLNTYRVVKTQKAPRLLVISRRKTRRFLNPGEIRSMARGLGFDVVVQETSQDMRRVSSFVNTFDALVGVHGAGLSNMLFLPENAVVVQVVGLGMDRIAEVDYGLPSMDMGLRYLEYRIGMNESSLIEKYPIGHEVFTNPSAITSQGWKAFEEVYLDNQDVKLDVIRFRGTLLKVLELLHT